MHDVKDYDHGLPPGWSDRNPEWARRIEQFDGAQRSIEAADARSNRVCGVIVLVGTFAAIAVVVAGIVAVWP